jgi:putative membrane protein
MKKAFVAMVVTLFVFVATGMLAAAPKSAGMPTGNAFLKQVADINLTEVELGKLAEQKGSNPAVKDFGKCMIEDHSKAQEALQLVAKQERVTLPAKPGADSEALYQKLEGLSGAEFDEVYLENMLAGHKGAISMLENEIEHERIQAIKDFAKATLPVIQDHIRVAENVAGKMGMSGAQGLSDPAKAIAAK